MGFLLNVDLMEEYYWKWKSDPGAVSREWQVFFQGFELGMSREEGPPTGTVSEEDAMLQARAGALVYAYRDLGHLLACLDPLAACPVDHPLLRLEAFELTEDDLDRSFHFSRSSTGSEKTSLRSALEMLKETYCRSVGVEYMHLQDPQERRWLRERMEKTRNRPSISEGEQWRILENLARAALFEEFLQSKYLGQKRFSLEGAEGVVAMLDGLVRRAAENGCQEIVLGMAHRGRLNVKAHLFGKSYTEIFRDFEDCYNPEALVGSGDVKYHKGAMSDATYEDGRTVRMLMVDNPSHLESVSPVVEGLARARQDALSGEDRFKAVLPLLLHGDAAFAGQGVVAETLNMSQLEGYRTGGTVHVVVNNQIGFTTLPEDARSTRYSTDVAKMLMAPVFHVHGEDPEALLHVARLACDYRMEFGKDAVIDVVCYRRHGHNEGDEPYYTQPQMYERIRQRPPVHRLYAQRLLEQGRVARERVDSLLEDIGNRLEEGLAEARDASCPLPVSHFYEAWDDIGSAYSHEPVETGVDLQRLGSLMDKLHSCPPDFQVNPKLQKIFDKRRKAFDEGKGLDWATGELLGFASLLTDGVSVRLSGEDSRRGTFSHRHSVLTDPETGKRCTPLARLDEGQAPFHVYDSLLSEYGVLGFEYGYSLADPGTLTLWEAQFGDFANGAQIVIDQYLAAAEAKWGRMSGLTLLLPHGYEGMGAEHSSARLERFLQLCADDNLQVCNPTTPAQYFHLLRRQVKVPFRKPLVIMSPKSLLRHPLAVSVPAELARGSFQPVLADPETKESAGRVVLCSGKLYYDLLRKREELDSRNVALVRLEQLHPFPEEALDAELRSFPKAEEWIWAQEESRNMGAWSFAAPRLEGLTGRKFTYVGRKASASPAAGHLTVHKEEQAALIEAVFENQVRRTKDGG